MSTSEHTDENNAICRGKREASERLHQSLHQIAASSERSVASVLVDAIVKTLGAEAVEQLLGTLNHEAEQATQLEEGGK